MRMRSSTKHITSQSWCWSYLDRCAERKKSRSFLLEVAQHVVDLRTFFLCDNETKSFRVSFSSMDTNISEVRLCSPTCSLSPPPLRRSSTIVQSGAVKKKVTSLSGFISFYCGRTPLIPLGMLVVLLLFLQSVPKEKSTTGHGKV